MEKLIFSVCVLTVTVCSLGATPYEYVERRNWHISVSGASAFPNYSDFDVKGTDGTVSGDETDWDNGPAVMVAGGYTFNNWRFDLEYSFRKTDINNSQAFALGGIADTKNEVTYHSIMANVSYDLYIFQQFYWYNGVGIGLSFPQFHSERNFDDTDVTFAYQLMTGLGYQIAKNFDLYAGYRFFRTTDMHYKNQIDGTEFDINIDVPWIHHIEAGIRMRF